ncbi:MAG TPA: DinB family protein, partial [Thermoanaerobaculia bacterium]|nr:DinB family protein [Thermoanaerobaculia bacterium]
MPIIDPILTELDFEARATTRVLERVPADRFDWTPHPRSTPVGKLAWHVASIPKRVEHLLRAGTFDVNTARPGEPPSTTPELVEVFHANLASVRAYMAGLSDETLRETFTMMRGDQLITKMAKVTLIRTVLMNHTYHHRGQLAVYLRLLEIPVPAIYGTSADES